MINDFIAVGIQQTDSEYYKRTLNTVIEHRIKYDDTYQNIIMSVQNYELWNPTHIFRSQHYFPEKKENILNNRILFRSYKWT